MIDCSQSFEQIKEAYNDLIKLEPMSWEEVKLRYKKWKITGVYVIYFNGEIIYIGSTKNFLVRFGTDLNHKSTHTLYNKLLREYPKEEVKDLIRNKFKYKIKECKDKPEAECLEHFAILINKPKYNHYFYKKPLTQA